MATQHVNNWTIVLTEQALETIYYYNNLMYIRVPCTPWISQSIFTTSKKWRQRTVNDVTQFCVCSDRGNRTLAAKSVGRGHGLAATGEAGNGSQVFTAASMLTVLRLISLTVAEPAANAVIKL